MLRSDREVESAVQKVEELRLQIEGETHRLQQFGLGPMQVEEAVGPLHSAHFLQTAEIEAYLGIKRGEFGELINLSGLGHMLVALRLANGISIRDLAKRLGVHESQISRDERNSYGGVTVERASRILTALGVTLRTRVEEATKTKSPSSSTPETHPTNETLEGSTMETRPIGIGVDRMARYNGDTGYILLGVTLRNSGAQDVEIQSMVYRLPAEGQADVLTVDVGLTSPSLPVPGLRLKSGSPPIMGNFLFRAPESWRSMITGSAELPGAVIMKFDRHVPVRADVPVCTWDHWRELRNRDAEGN